MKQYLLAIYQPAGPPPPADVLARVTRDVEALRQEMKAAGAWVFSDGLHDPSTATVVRVSARGETDQRVSARDAEFIVTDGPFAEGKEHVGGLIILRAPDLDAALAWACKAARAITLPIEVRPFRSEPEG